MVGDAAVRFWLVQNGCRDRTLVIGFFAVAQSRGRASLGWPGCRARGLQGLPPVRAIRPPARAARRMERSGAAERGAAKIQAANERITRPRRPAADLRDAPAKAEALQKDRPHVTEESQAKGAVGTVPWFPRHGPQAPPASSAGEDGGGAPSVRRFQSAMRALPPLAARGHS